MAGIFATLLLVTFLLLSEEVRTQYYLYRLHDGTPQYLSARMGRSAGGAEREAVKRFVATEKGRGQLLSLAVSDLDAELTLPRGMRRRGPPTPPPSLQHYYPHGLIGMRYRDDKDAWVLWGDLRRPGTTIRASVATHDPSFASDRAFHEALEALCRAADPLEEILVPGYPEHRFHIEPFAEGLERYEALLAPHGQSIEDSAYWYETLEDWREMLQAGTLLPWVIRARRVEP